MRTRGRTDLGSAVASELDPAAWRPEVPPVEGGERPLWSVMVPTYNRAEYLAVALESVLAQDPGPGQMQIEVVDDHSREAIGEIVAEVGQGRVAFFRQEENVGSTRNFTACIQRARGHLVHILHGDDAVRPGFYEQMARPFEAMPELGAAFCGYIMIDRAGLWDIISPRVETHAGVLASWVERIALENPASVGGTVVRRSVYERLGSFDTRISNGEDWEMWVRIAAHYPVWFEPEPLALYRRHEVSISAHDLATGGNVQDARRIIELNRSLLPADREPELTARARELAAVAALRHGLNAIARGDTSTWWTQNVEALRTSRSSTVLTHAAYFGVRGARHWLRQRTRRARA
jgi:glycosyltransferase involved in cell wall biosynthesis